MSCVIWYQNCGLELLGYTWYFSSNEKWYLLHIFHLQKSWSLPKCKGEGQSEQKNDWYFSSSGMIEFWQLTVQFWPFSTKFSDFFWTFFNNALNLLKVTSLSYFIDLVQVNLVFEASSNIVLLQPEKADFLWLSLLKIQNLTI